MEGATIRLWRDSALGAAGADVLLSRRTRHAYSPHIHPEWTIAIFEDGAQSYRVERAAAVATCGSLLLIPPFALHSATAAGTHGHWSHRAIYPDVETLAEIIEAVNGRTSGALEPAGGMLRHDAKLAARLAAMHRGIVASPDDPLLRQHLFAGMMRELVPWLSPRSNRSGARCCRAAIRRAREYMHAHFTRPGLEVAELACAAELSRYHFMRSFRAEMGISAHAYLVQLRVAAARDRLSDGEEGAHVAVACGFADQSHMIRHFRRSLGVTPGAYAADTRRRGAA